jgi:hypothetical protein
VASFLRYPFFLSFSREKMRRRGEKQIIKREPAQEEEEEQKEEEDQRVKVEKWKGRRTKKGRNTESSKTQPQTSCGKKGQRKTHNQMDEKERNLIEQNGT